MMKIAKRYGLQLKSNEKQAHIYFGIQDWLTNFYKYYETKEEWDLSRTQLLGFLDSSTVINGLGEACSEAMKSYVITSFLPHESSIAYYIHMHNLNFEKCTSNPCEAMNHAMKHSKSSMKANMNLNNSMKSIHENASQKQRMRKPENYKKLVSEAVRAHSPTASHITPLAEGILNKEWNSISNYTIIRTGLYEFKCLFNIPDEDTSNHHFIQSFQGEEK